LSIENGSFSAAGSNKDPSTAWKGLPLGRQCFLVVCMHNTTPTGFLWRGYKEHAGSKPVAPPGPFRHRNCPVTPLPPSVCQLAAAGTFVTHAIRCRLLRGTSLTVTEKRGRVGECSSFTFLRRSLIGWDQLPVSDTCTVRSVWFILRQKQSDLNTVITGYYRGCGESEREKVR
jgi:hypothetical protein